MCWHVDMQQRVIPDRYCIHCDSKCISGHNFITGYPKYGYTFAQSEKILRYSVTITMWFCSELEVLANFLFNLSQKYYTDKLTLAQYECCSLDVHSHAGAVLYNGWNLRDIHVLVPPLMSGTVSANTDTMNGAHRIFTNMNRSSTLNGKINIMCEWCTLDIHEHEL